MGVLGVRQGVSLPLRVFLQMKVESLGPIHYLRQEQKGKFISSLF